MQTLISIQHWLYGGMGKGLGEVAGGNASARAGSLAVLGFGLFTLFRA